MTKLGRRLASSEVSRRVVYDRARVPEEETMSRMHLVLASSILLIVLGVALLVGTFAVYPGISNMLDSAETTTQNLTQQVGPMLSSTQSALLSVQATLNSTQESLNAARPALTSAAQLSGTSAGTLGGYGSSMSGYGSSLSSLCVPTYISTPFCPFGQLGTTLASLGGTLQGTGQGLQGISSSLTTVASALPTNLATDNAQLTQIRLSLGQMQTSINQTSIMLPTYFDQAHLLLAYAVYAMAGFGIVLIFTGFSLIQARMTVLATNRKIEALSRRLTAIEKIESSAEPVHDLIPNLPRRNEEQA